MTQIIEAIYEDGAFRPVNPQQVLAANGQSVTLVVQTEDGSDANSVVDPLSLAARVYDGLSPDQIDQIEHLALDRRGFRQRDAFGI